MPRKGNGQMPRDDCIHHWLIESAKGKKSRGQCHKCGGVKSFLNHIPEHSYRTYNNEYLENKTIKQKEEDA